MKKPKLLEFVPVVEADRAFFIDVHHRAYRNTIEEMFGWDEALQDQRAAMAFDRGGMYNVIHDKAKVGVVGWEDHAGYVWLKEVFILPEYQNRGFGSEILRISINKANDARKDIRLQTLKANLRAKAFYERHGFTVTEGTDIHWKMCLPFSDMV
jgi:ribosomal protein S18 acetylase RimI-like enzyme